MRLPKKRLSAFAVTAAAAATLLGPAAAAQAATVNNWPGGSSVEQDTATGWCSVAVDWTTATKNAPAYALGYFDNVDAGWSCTAWLERSTDGGATWHQISGTHTLESGAAVYYQLTYNYYDGPGYLARSCFKFPWNGAAIHCTSGI